ncbi:hypothetical protein GCM10010123_41600 [Pilimelia anulata]|uniref:Uncharacterized protein n=1 Tax=Pilimelia anulata TaxID=53371 RepID=A0A8J3FE84_9ACTN|nr:hypothetical protein [Pilimelia anulata]GGK07373.1 hypothetical protein GCM10010123_41600 [Pilimelia anulata]
MRAIRFLTAAAAVALGATTVPAPAAAATLFAPQPPAGEQLVTNEYAYWNPADPRAHRSADWQLDSGSLFARPSTDGMAFWSGPVNDRAPDADSARGTNSAILRLVSKRTDFGDAQVRTKLWVSAQTATRSTPAVDWDGVHLFLRYQGEESLYYVSVARRDGAIVVKKKCPGGPSNGGTYYTLASKSGYRIAASQWKWYSAYAKSNPDGSVTLGAARVDLPVLSVTDRGTGCAPIRKPGRVGVRGDNTDFQFTNFRATSL